jgi:hypothetical protein
MMMILSRGGQDSQGYATVHTLSSTEYSAARPLNKVSSRDRSLRVLICLV